MHFCNIIIIFSLPIVFVCNVKTRLAFNPSFICWGLLSPDEHDEILCDATSDQTRSDFLFYNIHGHLVSYDRKQS